MEKSLLSPSPSVYSRARCLGGGSDGSSAGAMREKHCESLPSSSISASFGRTAFGRAVSPSRPADPEATAGSDEGLITAGFAGRRRVPGDGVVPEERTVVRRRSSPRLMGQLTTATRFHGVFSRDRRRIKRNGRDPINRGFCNCPGHTARYAAVRRGETGKREKSVRSFPKPFGFSY